jgi:hypothetical protein
MYVPWLYTFAKPFSTFFNRCIIYIQVLGQIMYSCLDRDPNKRPSFDRLISYFDKLQPFKRMSHLSRPLATGDSTRPDDGEEAQQ